MAQAVRNGPEANEAAMDILITHITFNQTTGTYTAKDTSQIMEIEEYVVPFSPKLDPRQAKDIPRNHSTKMVIFPDNGATICLWGLKHLQNIGLSTNNLIHLGKSFEQWEFLPPCVKASFPWNSVSRIRQASPVHMQKNPKAVFQQSSLH